ncbi:MAG: hypothetical protein ACRD2Z_01990 [Thermoanaerobaculia bacterium]
MRKPTTLAFTALVAGVLLMPATADAVHDQGRNFSIRSHVNIGGLDVAFAYGSYGRYAPAYYYRFPRPIAYHGYHCTDRCFVGGGHYYHYQSCPVVSIYFRNHRFDPGYFYARSAPPVYVPTYPPQVRYHVPPGHRKHGRHWVPPGHRKHHPHGYVGHPRGRGGHWEWDDGRWKWDDD